MLGLQNLLAVLILIFFTPAIHALATPDQAAIGKVRGWTGPANAKPSGDYLTAVFCYCAYPPKMEEVMGPAHFYQFEYFNKHHDTTFILTSACPDGDIGFDITCVPYGGGRGVLTERTMDENCKYWEGYEMVNGRKVRRHDELCYIPHWKHDTDYIRFNRQVRNLGPKGHQGGIVVDLEPGTCENLCTENLDMHELHDDKNFPPSHQIEWTKMDDMCHGCE